MQISVTRLSDKDRPVRAAWGRGKVAWGGVGLSRVEYHGTDAEASLTSGRRPSGVGGYTHTHTHIPYAYACTYNIPIPTHTYIYIYMYTQYTITCA